MPLPASAKALPTAVEDVDSALSDLPATPTEADLPAIVEIVADIKTILATITEVISTVRINQ